MKKLNYTFEYQTYSRDEISQKDLELIQKSYNIAEQAYAPYSKFKVGASVLLDNGAIFTGNNQENASYPVGVCAERALLSYVHANFPKQKKIKLAITALALEQAVTPCGMCRQTLLEYEKLQNQPIELYLAGNQGDIIYLESTSLLLPLHFNSDFLNS